MTREFTFSFQDSNISPANIEDLLNSENIVSEPVRSNVEKGMKEALRYTNIRGIVKIFDAIELDKNKGTQKIGD